MRLMFGIFILLLCGAPVVAADDPVIARLDAAWTAWAKENRVKHGAMVIIRRGKPVHQSEINASVNQRFELASLSKAITGVCVDALVKKGKLS